MRWIYHQHARVHSAIGVHIEGVFFVGLQIRRPAYAFLRLRPTIIRNTPEGVSFLIHIYYLCIVFYLVCEEEISSKEFPASGISGRHARRVVRQHRVVETEFLLDSKLCAVFASFQVLHTHTHIAPQTVRLKVH